MCKFIILGIMHNHHDMNMFLEASWDFIFIDLPYNTCFILLTQSFGPNKPSNKSKSQTRNVQWSPTETICSPINSFSKFEPTCPSKVASSRSFDLALPPSLPLAQHCVSTDWPLHTRCPPHQCNPLQHLKTQIKDQCHNHRKPLSYQIHRISTRAGNKHCNVSWLCIVFRGAMSWFVESGDWANLSFVNHYEAIVLKMVHYIEALVTPPGQSLVLQLYGNY